MAYALRFDGNFYAELASQVQLSGAGSLGWRVEFDIEPDNIAGAAHGFMSGILNNGRTRFIKSSNDGFTLSARGLVSGSVLGDSGSFAAGQSWPNSPLTVIAYSRESGGTGATVNGSGGTNATAGRNFDLFRIGDGATTNLFRGLMYEVRVYQNDVLIHRFKNTVGTGNVWTDQVGGNNATLGGTVPSDNSQWVFYDDGGTANESTVSYDLGSIDYAVSSQITAPAISSTVSYDIGAIDYVVSAQQLAPGNNASLSYDIGAISYAVSAQQSEPQFSASVGYEIGGIGFAVQANTGTPVNTATAAYDLGGIGYSVSAQSVAPQLIASLAYDVGSIDYAVNANTGTPIRAATVGYDIGDISWQVNAQWQPSDALAIIGYDIGSIGFLVQARSGDVVVSSASDAGLSFKELARGLSFKEQPRGIKFTEPPRGVRV